MLYNCSVVREPLHTQAMDTENKAILTQLEPDGTYIIYPCDVSTWHGDEAQEVTMSPVASDGAAVWANSSIVCEERYEEHDQETEDSCVTIIIYDASTSAENNDASLETPDAYLTSSAVPPDDAVLIRKSLGECLKLAFSREAEACCFLCPEESTSFTDLKKHFTEVHNLTQSIAQLSDLRSDSINQLAKEIKHLECSCTTFLCTTCEEKFSSIPELMQHILLSHPTTYGSFPFFTEQQQNDPKKCQQCTILGKLCHIDYELFMRVLLECCECSDESCKVLLSSWPLADLPEPCMWCSEEDEQVNRHSELKDGTDAETREVVCYRIKQGIKKKGSQKAKAPVCICPILKCPNCPKTVANFADLCKHIRMNSHSNWHDMKILWDKHKIIKENCPICPKYSYHCYILCPHCPHLAFDSEKAAQAHMDSQHNSQSKNKGSLVCTCPNHYMCLKCNTSYPTPQSLHHHLQQMQHMTEKTVAAIPAMIQRSIKDRKECPRCSLQNSDKISGVYQEQECSCRWVKCSVCKTSFRKVSSLLHHIDKAKHTMSATDIRKEKEQLASSIKTCHRCCNGVVKYCILCHRREDSLHTHLRTRHEDQQIMLLRNDSGAFLEELHMAGWDQGRLPRYECSVCLLRLPCINKLRHHVCQQHPQCYFTLFCLDLSNDVLQVKDFAAHEQLMVLNVVSKR